MYWPPLIHWPPALPPGVYNFGTAVPPSPSSSEWYTTEGGEEEGDEEKDEDEEKDGEGEEDGKEEQHHNPNNHPSGPGPVGGMPPSA
ncbi:hypothetical protein E5D57_001219 [Metarhizium anisopliae]|nr:hypothetical protein E5D57_001219 [Metarhizium anisopliae]